LFIKQNSLKGNTKHQSRKQHICRHIQSILTFPLTVPHTPGVEKRGAQLDHVRKIPTLDHVDKNYPRGAWTRVYTDGSATDSTRNGGTGVLLQCTDSEETLVLPTGIFFTKYLAEIEELTAAANAVSQNSGRVRGQVVIFTDALSVLQALQSFHSKDLNELSLL
jgi:hypothetical protein